MVLEFKLKFRTSLCVFAQFKNWISKLCIQTSAFFSIFHSSLADQKKEEGNQLYLAKNYREALQRYNEAISESYFSYSSAVRGVAQNANLLPRISFNYFQMKDLLISLIVVQVQKITTKRKNPCDCSKFPLHINFKLILKQNGNNKLYLK